MPPWCRPVGAGSINYTLMEPQVEIGPDIPTRDDLDGKIRERMGGQAGDADVQAEIKKYREQ